MALRVRITSRAKQEITDIKRFISSMTCEQRSECVKVSIER